MIAGRNSSGVVGFANTDWLTPRYAGSKNNILNRPDHVSVLIFLLSGAVRILRCSVADTQDQSQEEKEERGGRRPEMETRQRHQEQVRQEDSAVQMKAGPRIILISITVY